MRRLLLIRHAKSSWDNPKLSDHDRPLNKRGQRDAPRMAQRLQTAGENVDAIYSSTAARALGIAEPIAEALQTDLIEAPDAYTFSGQSLLQLLYELPDHQQRLAVVGHNPAITDAANWLIDTIIDNVPTSGIVTLDCDIDSWQQLDKNVCHLIGFDYPKRGPK